MRKLEEHFCTYEQAQNLIKLGLSQDKYGLSVEQYGTDEFGYSGFLRSQALDFFRDKGYDFQIGSHLNKGYWFACSINSYGYALPNFKRTYPEAESALIDKLIELEKEAQNGK